MIKKRTYIIGALLLTLSIAAFAQIDSPEFTELMNNQRYVDLKRKSIELAHKEDSIQSLANDMRGEFSSKRDSMVLSEVDFDRYVSQILHFEEQIFEIKKRRGDVMTEINKLEGEFIKRKMYSNLMEAERAKDIERDIHADINNIADENNTVSIVAYRDLVKNPIFIELLSPEDYSELLVASAEDAAMDKLTSEYLETYNRLSRTATDYNAAEVEADANILFDEYQALNEKADSLNREIERVWNHIIDTKYYALGYVLEKRLRYDLIDKSSADFTTMQQKCSANDGYYASDALAHYVSGRPTLLDFEIGFAVEMELSDALDSLQGVRSNMRLPEYRLNPVNIERRLFLDYAPITVGKTNFYNASNPLPELKVYERGTIYRILLGSFRNKQPMTLFKGVQPLAIARDEEGNYAYYAGGFATRGEVDEALVFLKDKGFKKPEVCRWRDGEMVNLSLAAEEDDTTEIIPVGSRYIVILECETLSDEVRATITATAPEKMISRTGGKFAVGTFADRSEADVLISILQDMHPDITVSIKELDL